MDNLGGDLFGPYSGEEVAKDFAYYSADVFHETETASDVCEKGQNDEFSRHQVGCSDPDGFIYRSQRPHALPASQTLI